MRTRSSSNLPVESPPNPSTSNPKRRNRRRSKQPFILEESPVDTMADQHTMAELLRAPIEGYAEAIVVPPILAEQFELKHSLINMMTSDQYKDLLRACPHHGCTELHQFDTFYNALNPAEHNSLNSAAGGNLLERRTQDVLTIIENKSKIAKLTHAVNQQTSVVTTAMTAILKQFQATSPPAFVKAVEEIYVTCGEEDERVEETLTNQDLAEYTIKVSPPLVQKPKPPSQRNFVVHQRDPLHPNIPYPSRMYKQKQQEKDEVQINNSPFQQGETFRTGKHTLNENCSVVILKKLPEKLGEPGKFLILCGFSELKCKALADLGASINLMLLFVWKKLGLPELISTRITLELANRAICTPVGIARDVFVPVGKFTFLADFVIVDYESDPKVPFILGRPFLRTTRALIDVHEEEMILRDGDERLALNMRHDTSSYSNQPQKESTNMINIYDDSNEDFLENLFETNHQKGGNVLPDKLLDLDSTKDLHPPHNVNPLCGNATSSSSSPNHLLEEFADELALITFPLEYDNDLSFDIETDLKEIEYLLDQDPIKDMDSILEDSVDQSNLADLNDNLVDTMPKMFTAEHALDYSSPPLYDEYDDDLFEVESDTEYVYDDPFDSKGEKIKDFKLLIDELDLPSDFLPPSEYDSFLSKDFSEVDALPSTNEEDKVFNPGILIQENLFKVIIRVAPEKNEKKLAISHISSILEDFNPPLYELSFFKEVPRDSQKVKTHAGFCPPVFTSSA
nr:hypothetical protein [Tanacetum cinerariifolium]